MEERFRQELENAGFTVGDEQDLLGLTDAEMDQVKARMSGPDRLPIGGDEVNSGNRRAMTSEPSETD